jgi:siderophore synthetase component
VSCLASLCQDHPFGETSRLGQIVHRQAAARAQPVTDAGRDWFARFCEVMVVSLVRLYLDVGLCFEPHQQNTLIELDADGLPGRGYYRDSQGYFHRELAHDDLCRALPGVGEATESIFPEALADERLVYYPFVNLTLGVIDALGAAGAADEAVLLGEIPEERPDRDAGRRRVCAETFGGLPRLLRGLVDGAAAHGEGPDRADPPVQADKRQMRCGRSVQS